MSFNAVQFITAVIIISSFDTGLCQRKNKGSGFLKIVVTQNYRISEFQKKKIIYKA